MFRLGNDILRVCERYARIIDSTTLILDETTDQRKIDPIRANYRPAFGWVRCGTCRFRQGTGCQQVRGTVTDDDVCDLFVLPASRNDDERVFPERYGRPFDESKIKRGHPKTGNRGQFAPKGSAGVGAKPKEETEKPEAKEQRPGSGQSKREFVESVQNKIAPKLPPTEGSPIPGMEGPFRYRTGAELYYDPKEGKYYDRGQDRYLDNEEAWQATQGTQEVTQQKAQSQAQPPQPTAQPATRPGVAALKPEHEQPPQVDPQSLERADALLAQPPASPDAWIQTWEAIERHPYCQEVRARLDSYKDDSPNGDIRQWSRGKHLDRDGNYTPERQAVHKEILGKLLNPNAKARPGQKPIAVFLMGPPAAGKTTAGAPLTKRLGVEFTTINPDDVKEMLPEYRGWNAGMLHEESSDVAEKMLTPEALKQQHNVLFDLTGNNSDKIENNINELAGKGYDVHVVNVSADNHTVGWRAWKRFRKKAFTAENGRYVPPDYAAIGVDGNPKQTFERAKQNSAVKGWLAADTSGFERGEGAKIIEEGGR